MRERARARAREREREGETVSGGGGRRGGAEYRATGGGHEGEGAR